MGDCVGRIRTLKPELLTDAKTARLSDTAWRMFVSALLLADDAGRLPADDVVVGGQVFPGRSFTEASRALVELSKASLVDLYEVRGQRYAEIRGFTKHQKIDRPSGPKFPAPSEAIVEPSSSPRRALDADHDHDHDLDRDHEREGELEGGRAPRSSPGGDVACGGGGGKQKRPRRPAGLAGASPDEFAAIERVIEKLSERAGRKYSPRTPQHAGRVLRLLREGYSEHDLRLVVWHQGNAWEGDPQWSKYLRPSTLFGPQKFADYVVEARAAHEEHERAEAARQAKHAELGWEATS